MSQRTDSLNVVIDNFKARLKRVFSRSVIEKLILVMIGWICFMYGMSQYGNRGCNDGTCTVMFAVHGLPYLLSWFLFWIAFSVYSRNKIGAYVIGIISIVINGILLSAIEPMNISELYYPGFILFGLQIGAIVYKRYLN